MVLTEGLRVVEEQREALLVTLGERVLEEDAVSERDTVDVGVVDDEREVEKEPTEGVTKSLRD